MISTPKLVGEQPTNIAMRLKDSTLLKQKQNPCVMLFNILY